MMTLPGAGKDGCRCINATAILASLPERRCRLSPGGDVGIRLTVDGACAPFSYGSSRCLQHDLLHDAPHCRAERAGEEILPSYCFRPWCFVDFGACRKESDVRAFRSSYFDFESGVDLYYSYATCNSTAEDWFDVEEGIMGEKEALGGISITASVPTYILPMMYKRDAYGEILASAGTEYYDDNIPFEGVYLKYADRIQESSHGDIRGINVTHRTKASSLVHPTSSFTAAVQDIADGLIDMSIGPFWITAQRLKLCAFTLPILYDKTVLVVPAPERNENIRYQITKVMRPFTLGLWGVLLCIIVLAALLSVWFNEDQSRIRDNNIRAQRGQESLRRRRAEAYARLALDEFLEKGLYFCSAGVENHTSSSLPVKILLFGFGFFVLIAVSAYTANLAASLVTSETSGVKTMPEAVARGYTICGHPALKTEMLNQWPTAQFYFHEHGKEFPGMLEDYDARKCQAMAVGYEDTSMDPLFLQGMCDRGLVYTKSLIVEIPVAFPIRSTIASGFSYWMYQAKRHGVTLEATKEEFPQNIECNVDYTEETTGGGFHDELRPANLFLPIMVFLCCSGMAVIIQIIHVRRLREKKSSILGRRSTLVTSLYTNDQVDEDFDWPRSSRMGSSSMALSTNDGVGVSSVRGRRLLEDFKIEQAAQQLRRRPQYPHNIEEEKRPDDKEEKKIDENDEAVEEVDDEQEIICMNNSGNDNNDCEKISRSKMIMKAMLEFSFTSRRAVEQPPSRAGQGQANTPPPSCLEPRGHF